MRAPHDNSTNIPLSRRPRGQCSFFAPPYAGRCSAEQPPATTPNASTPLLSRSLSSFESTSQIGIIRLALCHQLWNLDGSSPRRSSCAEEEEAVLRCQIATAARAPCAKANTTQTGSPCFNVSNRGSTCYHRVVHPIQRSSAQRHGAKQHITCPRGLARSLQAQPRRAQDPRHQVNHPSPIIIILVKQHYA